MDESLLIIRLMEENANGRGCKCMLKLACVNWIWLHAYSKTCSWTHCFLSVPVTFVITQTTTFWLPCEAHRDYVEWCERLRKSSAEWWDITEAMEGCTSTHTCVIRAAERASSCVCELGGVNPLLINGCTCCAEDTNGSVFHACMHAPHSVSASRTLSLFWYISASLYPCPLFKVAWRAVSVWE